MSTSSNPFPASPQPPTPRYLAVWLPHLPTDRLRLQHGGSFCGLPDDVPLVVTERIKSSDTLVAVDVAALRLGLRPGLTLADARARLPLLYAAPFDSRADAAVLDAVAADCDRYTPLVGRDPPDGVTLNITGAAHLFGGEARLGVSIARRLTASGLTARLAIAGAPDTARALARYASTTRKSLADISRADLAHPVIIKEGGDAEAVLPLPVVALRLPQETVSGLLRAGLKTVGCLARRPRAPLAARFGAELIDRLERTLGHVLSPISPWRPEPVTHADLACGEPIVRSEDIDHALAHLAAVLATELDARERGARRIEAAFFRVDGAVRRIEVAMARPCRDPDAIIRLLAERLAALASPLDPGFGFDRIRLSAIIAEPLMPAQADLGSARQADAGLPDLIDRLSARFGAVNVVRYRSRDSHIPERASAMAPATELNAPSDHIDQRWPAAEAGEPPLRPASLFDPPQRIEAMAPLPDGPPLRFRWRRVVHDVVLAEGPERIAPEWWHRHQPSSAVSSAVTPHAQADLPRIRAKPPAREDIPRKRPSKRDAPPCIELTPAKADKPRGEDGEPQTRLDWLALERDYYRVEDRNGRRFWLFRAGLWTPGGEPPRWFLHGLFA